MMKTDLPNLLTASSILVGIITALYGLFYPEIKNIIDIIPKKHKADNEQYYEEGKRTIKGKYLPLLLGSIIITLVYIPELYKQLLNSIHIIKTNGIKNSSYDVLTASFIVICFFMMLITIMLIRTGIKLRKKMKKLNPDEK